MQNVMELRFLWRSRESHGEVVPRRVTVLNLSVRSFFVSGGVIR